jgi:hypothetical protein
MLGEIEHADALGDPVQRSSYLLNVPAAGLIIVTDDDYIGAVQRSQYSGRHFPAPIGLVVATRPRARRFSTSLSPSGI